MKILIASGGSGGHIFPAMALAGRLKSKWDDIDIRFVGSNKALDRRIFEKEGYPFSLLSANKLHYNKNAFQSLIFFIGLSFDLLKSFFIVASYRPDVVVGFGGYVSGPVILVAYLFRIPRMVHEQNVVPGRANRFLFRIVNKIAFSFPETKEYLGPYVNKAIFTGNPIRAGAFFAASGRGDRLKGLAKLGLKEGKFTILVIGGSQGAHFLNESFIGAMGEIDEKTRATLQVIHIAGIKDYGWITKEYESLGLEHRVWSFIDEIEEAYSASDLVVTRSGASAIFELAYFARPMILVPYPFAMSHQVENARAFSKKGACVELDERRLSAESFRDEILSLLNDRERLKALAESASGLSMPKASDNLAEQVLGLVERG